MHLEYLFLFQRGQLRDYLSIFEAFQVENDKQAMESSTADGTAPSAQRLLPAPPVIRGTPLATKNAFVCIGAAPTPKQSK